MLSASLRSSSCCCCCGCWDDGDSSLRQRASIGASRLGLVSCWKGKEGGLSGEGDERVHGRVLACPSPVAFIFHVEKTTTTRRALECSVPMPLLAAASFQLISRPSSGQYDRLLIVEIERHFHLVWRSVLARRAFPDVIPAFPSVHRLSLGHAVASNSNSYTVSTINTKTHTRGFIYWNLW